MERMKEFSIAGIDNLPSTSDPDYYKIVIDGSNSMSDKQKIVIECLEKYKNELLKIDESTAIFISKAVFDEEYDETKYESVDDFSTKYHIGGGTDLYGAIVKSVNSTIKAQEKLIEEAFEPRMTIIILTDGEQCCYSCQYNEVDAKNAVEKAIENGITVVFIDFGENNGKIPKELGFQTIYSCEDSIEALKETFVKITTSCIRQSQSKVVNPTDWLI